MQITDARGNTLQLTESGRAKVDNPSPIAIISEMEGYAFVFDTGDISVDADDTVILVKNNATERNFHVDSVEWLLDSSPVLTVHCPVCASPAGTTITPVNLNRGSGIAAPATAISDETTNTQANVVARKKAEQDVMFFNGSLIIGPGGCVAVDTDGDIISAQLIIRGFFKGTE